MKTILHEGNQYVLRFDRGEEVISSLKQFCQQEKIVSVFFYGLGACSYLKLAYYNLETKKYQEQEFDRDLEIAGVSGNIAEFENDLTVHMHGSFADETMKALGGHVVSMKTAGTCEIFLTKFGQPMTRKFNPETGLKLLD
ncbi:MAG: PPC domain-containing DNA-binding protein [Candidatus Doudnabacteria bacterium]